MMGNSKHLHDIVKLAKDNAARKPVEWSAPNSR